MQEAAVRNIMIIVAVMTVIVGSLLLLVARWSAEVSGQPISRHMVRSAILLIAAGPLNLMVWLLFNGVLAGVGSRKVVGYALAAIAFVVTGLATGFFSRLRSGRSGGTEER